MEKVANFSAFRVAMLGVFLAGMYYVMAFNSGAQISEEISRIKVQIAEENVKKLETNRVLQKEEQMRADITMLVKKYEEVKSRIPIEFLESELRIIIDQFASQFDLKTIRNVRATKGKDFGASEDSNLVDQVVLDYSLVGNFYSLEKLINQISKTDKLVKVEHFEIITTNKRTDPNTPKELVLNATIIGFKQSSVALNQNKTGGIK
jgi:hypothetical protein